MAPCEDPLTQRSKPGNPSLSTSPLPFELRKALPAWQSGCKAFPPPLKSRAPTKGQLCRGPGHRGELEVPRSSLSSVHLSPSNIASPPPPTPLPSMPAQVPQLSLFSPGMIGVRTPCVQPHSRPLSLAPLGPCPASLRPQSLILLTCKRHVADRGDHD